MKIARIIYLKKNGEFSVTAQKIFIDFSKSKLISIYTDNIGNRIIGRYGTNKSTLKKLLKTAIEKKGW